MIHEFLCCTMLDFWTYVGLDFYRQSEEVSSSRTVVMAGAVFNQRS